MNLSHGTVVAICLLVAAAATGVDLVLEASGHPSFDPQPLYVFLALVLGQQGARVSSQKNPPEGEDDE